MDSGADRTVLWDGLVNGRDLGGLPTAHGPIEFRRLVRSASVHTLSARGWEELVDYGIETIIDLRHQREIDEAPIPLHLRRSDVNLLPVPLEPPGYVESWSARDDCWKLSTPLYFHEFMSDHAHRVAAVLQAIASAPPGGILLHCYGGKDRAGLSIAMLLDLLGVDRSIIVADHWISFDRPQSIEAELGKTEPPGKPHPDQTEYADIMVNLLSEHPATTCFADPAAAHEARASLVKRLCTVR